MSQAGYLSEKGKGRVGEFTMRVEFQTAFRAYGEMQGKGRNRKREMDGCELNWAANISHIQRRGAT